ncbi:MAG TPA: glutathione S-transferase family protein [Methylovirgula sp.]|nr:glutathione S-transferase family protein [Methylovirgula sp.]
MASEIIFYHAPNARSGGTLLLLEELGAPYELRVLNLNKGEQRQPAYLAINPMGKVPAIVHGESLITEQVAIYIYLADLFPVAGLAPQIGDPQRGPYLRWLAFYGSCFEPAMTDRALKRDSGTPRASPYGDFETMFGTLTKQLEQGPYLLGERFSAADLLWGLSLAYMVGWKLVPDLPAIVAYTARIGARPAVARVKAKDAELAAAQA